MLAAAVGGALLTSAGPVTPAWADSPRRIVAGWLPSWDAAAALAAATGNADLFNEASPFWHTATASGGSVTLGSSLGAGVIAQHVAALRQAGIPVLPSIADGSAARAMAGILADPAARAAHVAQIVALVTANGYDGIELDYEKFAFKDGTSSWATTRPAWVAFVSELAAALHAGGKRLAVAVPPTYAAGQASAAGYWVYDLASIGQIVDSLRIMAYDYSVSAPGPIAPLSFVRRSVAYTATVVPPERIHLGIPAYGRVWTARRADGSAAVTGTCPAGAVPATTSFTAARALAFLADRAGAPVTPTWNAENGEATATFTRTYSGNDSAGRATSCDVTQVAWWVDSAGTLARMAVMDEFRLGGAAIWQLAGVGADTWTALRTYASGGAPAPPTPTPTPTAATPTPKPSTTRAATTVALVAPGSARARAKVTVRATIGSTVAVPARTKVSLARRVAGSRKWVALGTHRTTAAGVVKFRVRVGARNTTWRVRVAATAKRAAGQATASTTVSPKVAAKASTTSPRPATVVRLSATLSPPVPGIRVFRQRLIANRWTTLGSTLTSVSGTAIFDVVPGRPRTDYVYRFVSAHTDHLGAGVSAHLTVRTK